MTIRGRFDVHGGKVVDLPAPKIDRRDGPEILAIMERGSARPIDGRETALVIPDHRSSCKPIAKAGRFIVEADRTM